MSGTWAEPQRFHLFQKGRAKLFAIVEPKVAFRELLPHPEDFERNSSNSYIKITDTDTVNSSEEMKSTGISPSVFGATLAILLIIIVICAVAIVIQHRRITNESSERTTNRESEKNVGNVTESHNFDVLQTGSQR